MLNLSPLFFTTSDNPHFFAELELHPSEKKHLQNCKEDIRRSLRENLKEELSNILQERGLEDLSVEPRFFIQGSWAYKTLNRPHTTPPQQADLDDGVYLPMSIMQESDRPSLASELFFFAAEAALMPLVQEKGWKMTTKSTCIRVEVSDYAHIDIPLYAIPDEDFAELKVALEERGFSNFHDAIQANSDSWLSIPTDKILLAHRDEGWIKSDPRAMRDWFTQAVADHGEQLRRVVRFLKAYRDRVWESGGPSSILLMAVAVLAFCQRKRRDDQALADVVKQVPELLRAGVKSPIDPGVLLTDSLSQEELEDAITRFEEFSEYLSAALRSTDSQTACNWLRKMLGPRFPNRPDLAIALSVSDVVKSQPAEAGPDELIKNTKAG